MNNSIYQLFIEVTRRCNFRCEHCMRGNPQRKDFNPEWLDVFLKNNRIGTIGTIVFTGGEPFLATNVIKQCIGVLRKRKCCVENFYIASNGSKYGIDEHMVVSELYCMCSENEISALEFSNTQFHQEFSEFQIPRLAKSFVFAGAKNTKRGGGGNKEQGTCYIGDECLLRIGRAASFGKREPDIPNVTIQINDDNSAEIGECGVYLSANKGVTFGCDMSYSMIDKYKFCDPADNVLSRVFDICKIKKVPPDVEIAEVSCDKSGRNWSVAWS